MPSLIEALQYRLPKTGYLDQHDNRGNLLKEDWGFYFYDRLVFIEQMGFRQGESLSAKKGTWEIWERPFFAIPNFPEGETVIHSSLGEYRRWGNEGPSHNGAILRMSYEPVPKEEFIQDLASFTKYYIERPWVWGFLSRLMTVEMIVEWWAKRQIPHINQYMSGQTAENALVAEQGHIGAVLVQRELFGALQKENIELTPEQFLRRIYPHIPLPLTQRRVAEITGAQVAGDESPKITEVALPYMLGVAKAILAVA